MATIVAKQDTWLKREPKQSSSLAAEKKVFVPKGSAHHWVEITMVAGEGHYRVSLERQPEEEWWFWPDHFTIVTDPKPPTVEVKPPSQHSVLHAPYYSQLDNYTDPHGTCYSSACAMMLKYLKPSSIKGDDEYLRKVLSYGASTDPNSQLAALKFYGLTAKFRQNGNWKDVQGLIKKGIPVPMGILHKGHVSRPTGGGHWITGVGVWGNYQGLIVHDPYGDLDLIHGRYGSKNGAYLRYSNKNLGPRWMVEGPGSGWFIEAVSW